MAGEVFFHPRLIRKAQIVPRLEHDGANQVRLAAVQPGSQFKTVLAGNMKGFAEAHPRKAAIVRQEGIKQADIGTGAAFITVIAGKAVVQEQAAVVKIHADGVFIANFIFVRLIGCGNGLEHRCQYALAIAMRTR